MSKAVRCRPLREKVVAYITHDHRLLVFTHADHPDAGVQVPAGTIEPGEAPARAVMREAYEETGLTDLRLRSLLGMRVHRFVRDAELHLHRRHYFHLEALGAVPDHWRHWERHPSGGDEAALAFELYWARLPKGVPDLAGELGVFIDRLPPATVGPSNSEHMS